MKSPRQAAIYLRRSTDRQEQSLEDQRTAILSYADEHGFEIVASFVDDAISGTSTTDRKGFLDMVEAAQTPRCPFQHVLVYDVKRFGRLDNDEAGYYRHLLRRAGVEVVYVSEGFNGDDTDDLLRPVKQWQARQESRDLAKVTIRGQLSLAEKGFWLGGAPPYGYDLLYLDSSGKPYQKVRFTMGGVKEVYSPSGQLLRKLPKGERISKSKQDRVRLAKGDPERVKVIVRIFRMYLDGTGFRGVAARLNDEGVPAPRNGSWSRIHDGRWAMSTIRAILVNPIYAGDMVWNRRTGAKFLRIEAGRAIPRERTGRYRLVHNPPDDWVVVQGTHEGLVDRHTFDRVQRLRGDREKAGGGSAFRRGRGKNSPFLLTGLITCKACGHHWVGQTIAKGKRKKNGERVKTRYYVCGGYLTKGNAVCKRVLLPQKEVDDFVLKEVEKRLKPFLETGGRQLLKRLVMKELNAQGPDPRQELAHAKKRMREVDEQASKLLDLVSEVNREFIDQKLGALKRERAGLEGRIEEMERLDVKPQDPAALAEEILKGMQEFARVVTQGTAEEKKLFVRGFVSGVAVKPRNREVRVSMSSLTST